MITSLNEPAPPICQVLRHPIHTPAQLFAIEKNPVVSPGRGNVIEDVTLRHLDTPSKMEKVQGLREHINLPSGCRDAQFFEREKKETSWALSLRSRCTAS